MNMDDGQSFLIGLKHALLVELIDLRSKEFLGLVPLNLHGIRKDSFVDEWLCFQVNVFGLFEPLQSSFFSHLGQVVYKITPNLLVFAELLNCPLNVPFICKLLHGLLMWDCNGNNEALCGLSMNEYFSQFITFHVCILDLLSSNILSLL